MAVLGGIPRGETDGPWREEQQTLIEQAVREWHEQKPKNVTKLHQQQRNGVLHQVKQGDFGILWNFNTGDKIDLDCFQKDAEQLYLALANACKGTDMVATKFDSL